MQRVAHHLSLAMCSGGIFNHNLVLVGGLLKARGSEPNLGRILRTSHAYYERVEKFYSIHQELLYTSSSKGKKNEKNKIKWGKKTEEAHIQWRIFEFLITARRKRK